MNRSIERCDVGFWIIAILALAIYGTTRPRGFGGGASAVHTKAEALKKGECGFTYFMGSLKSDNPRRPIAATPMIPGTDRFDPEPFKGKTIILRADNSITSYPIFKTTGHIKEAGIDLMDPANPIWDGHPPMIAWPDL